MSSLILSSEKTTIFCWYFWIYSVGFFSIKYSTWTLKVRWLCLLLHGRGRVWDWCIYIKKRKEKRFFVQFVIRPNIFNPFFCSSMNYSNCVVHKFKIQTQTFSIFNSDIRSKILLTLLEHFFLQKSMLMVTIGKI